MSTVDVVLLGQVREAGSPWCAAEELWHDRELHGHQYILSRIEVKFLAEFLEKEISGLNENSKIVLNFSSFLF